MQIADAVTDQNHQQQIPSRILVELISQFRVRFVFAWLSAKSVLIYEIRRSGSNKSHPTAGRRRSDESRCHSLSVSTNCSTFWRRDNGCGEMLKDDDGIKFDYLPTKNSVTVVSLLSVRYNVQWLFGFTFYQVAMTMY